MEKVATQNMFYDEQGRHVRTKKEILDGDGTTQAERAERKRKEAGRDYRARQNDKGARNREQSDGILHLCDSFCT